jgi:hypothetical protein
MITVDLMIVYLVYPLDFYTIYYFMYSFDLVEAVSTIDDYTIDAFPSIHSQIFYM